MSTNPRRHPRRVPKLCGGDVELGNFVAGLDRPGGTGYEASRALLAQIDGVRARQSYGWAGSTGYANPQDEGRVFLSSNGGCAYIDLDHLELCIPEVRSARDHVAASHAMLRLARHAQQRANQRLPEDVRIRVLANNSDGQSHSYGSHLNLLISRPAYEDLFDRRLQNLLLLASHQVSSIVLTGQGKVGAENGLPHSDFQLSARADFMETLMGPQTTYRRPIVNSRDEALCGEAGGLARLHCIFFDQTLCQVAGQLKVGGMQIVAALLEAGRVDPGCILEDPLQALWRWSRDPELRARCRTLDGRHLSAVELQQRLLECAARGFARGELDSVPEASELLELWGATLDCLERRDFDALARRLDWVLKLRLLDSVRQRRPDVSHEELRYLDQVYASLDPADGLFWPLEARGLVERVVPEARVAELERAPPEDTRAWTRAMLLRSAEPEEVAHVDWDRVRLWGCELSLDDPLGFGRASAERAFPPGATAREAALALGATDAPARLRSLTPRSPIPGRGGAIH